MLFISLLRGKRTIYIYIFIQLRSALCVCFSWIASRRAELQSCTTAPHWSNRSIADSYVRSKIKRLLDNKNICRRCRLCRLIVAALHTSESNCVFITTALSVITDRLILLSIYVLITASMKDVFLVSHCKDALNQSVLYNKADESEKCLNDLWIMNIIDSSRDKI